MTNPHHGDVVVGLGDPDTGLAAVDWAAREAELRHRDLHVVRAYRWTPGIAHWAAEGDETLRAELAAAVRSQLAAAVEHVQSAHPRVVVRGTVVEGDAAHALTELATAADLVVLGSRHLGVVGAAVLGSVSTLVAARAAGPVVVVNGPAGDSAEHPVVVAGVDGSTVDHDVLAFAFDHASRHRRPLHVIYCWRPDVLAAMSWRPEQPAPERARRWLAEAVSGWQETYPDVVIDQSARPGPPRRGVGRRVQVPGPARGGRPRPPRPPLRRCWGR